eukprot:361013-Chlamydomonas_euryale.AAC.6
MGACSHAACPEWQAGELPAPLGRACVSERVLVRQAARHGYGRAKELVRLLSLSLSPIAAPPVCAATRAQPAGRPHYKSGRRSARGSSGVNVSGKRRRRSESSPAAVRRHGALPEQPNCRLAARGVQLSGGPDGLCGRCLSRLTENFRD